MRPLTDATLIVRDTIYTGLLVRKGEVLTEALARERANNLCMAVIEALKQLAEESKPPPVRFPERPNPNDDDERIR
jgi:hypothetical protein